MTDQPNESRPTYAVLPVGQPPRQTPEAPPPAREIRAPIHYQFVTNAGTLLDVLA